MTSSGYIVETIPLNHTDFQSCLAIQQEHCWTSLNFATKIFAHFICCDSKSLPGCHQVLLA